MNRILITGASGHIGKRVAELLSGQELRLMARKPEKLGAFNGAEKVQGDYSDPASLAAAFKGIQTAFIVSGYAAPGERALLHKNAIDAAARAGVSHMVYLSFQGAAPDSKFPMSRDHFQTEAFIRQSGIAYTILRDSFYLDLVPEMFGKARNMKGPGGNGKVAWVSREDAAACVSAVLQNPGKFTGTYVLTGPAALSLAETADGLSAVTGNAYTYIEETVEEGTKWRNELSAPAWEVETWIGSYLAIAAGEVAPVSTAVKDITGQEPMNMETYFTRFPEGLFV